MGVTNTSPEHEASRRRSTQERAASRTHFPAAKSKEKADIRRRGLRSPRSIPFSELAQNPLYALVAQATLPEGLKIELARFGFATPADVVALESARALREHLRQREGQGESPPEAISEFYAQARREAIRGYRLMRHVLALKDPMNQGLLHTRARLPSAVEEALREAGGQAFAKPSSLQSNQSVAAYLRHLYRIATGLDKDLGIFPTAAGETHPLLKRRPDLAKLVLSESNLKQEISTVHLVNEVLEAGLDDDVDLDDLFYPVALPFDQPAQETRTALFQIGGTTLNSIRARTEPSSFPLRAGFRLAGDQAGLLSMTATEVALLAETGVRSDGDNPLTLEDLYGTSDNAEACQVARLLSSFELDFDELAQALGLYVVLQENGEEVAPRQFAAVLFDREESPEIVDGVVHLDGRPMTPPYLRALHYLVRLYRSTGLAFHHLNWLLATPGAIADNQHDSPSNARRRITDTGLRILATYPLYRDSFDLGPEAFAALFGEICPFWRADTVRPGQENITAGLEQTEVSFLHALFGDDSPRLHALLAAQATSINDAELREIVRRGLSLSELELAALVDALGASHPIETGLTASGLGALYRLSTIFRMIGWPLLPGLALTKLVSAQVMPDDALWVGLTGLNLSPEDTERLCTSLDWLVELSRFMKEEELSPDTLLQLLTETDDARPLEASTADRDWLNKLASAAAPTRLGPDAFRAFETWVAQDDTVDSDVWHQHLSAPEGLYRPSSGVFLPDQDRAAIDAACRGVLSERGVDLQNSTNTDQLDRLISHLERIRDVQGRIVSRNLPALGANVTVEASRALIRWAQTDPLDALDELLPSDRDGDDQIDAVARRRLEELRRYVAAVDAFGFGDMSLELIADHPQWLAAEAAHTVNGADAPKPLDLLQLVYLQRFETLQVGGASDEAWLGYLKLAREARPGDTASGGAKQRWRDGCVEALAILLGCPVGDATAYVDALVGADEVPDDVRTIDAFARHVRLAEELEVGAAELLPLVAVSDGAPAEPSVWGVAATAARSGLKRFEDGRFVPSFQNALGETRRDALVAAYLQLSIARDPNLKRTVTDRETLYSHLLLDVNVTSAVPTSRLVEAMSSLQLYISRALAGRERDVGFAEPGQDPVDGDESLPGHRERLAGQWQLDKYYRLWEANQKLLLYPQNYIEPDLRYISSPEFEDLLSAVSRSDINENDIENAVNAYMAGLAQCCDLSVCSIYVEREESPVLPLNATYHFLAAANWEKGRFFYRNLEVDNKTIANLPDAKQFLKALDWTYWQEVVIPQTYEILSDVAIAFWENRYFFFWLELEEQRTQDGAGKETITARIHPRYMRCDANAFTGTMRTPALVAKGAPAELTIDNGAFSWRGPEPTMNGTYHPVVRTGRFSLSASDANAEAAPELSPALLVTFGVDFKGNRAALKMTLTPEWAEAQLSWGEKLDLAFNDNAPPAYAGLSPRVPSADSCLVENDTTDKTYLHHDPSLSTVYEHNTPHVSRIRDFAIVSKADSGKAQARFKPAPALGLGIGSIRVYGDTGHCYFILLNRGATSSGYDPDGTYEFMTASEGTIIQTRIVLHFTVQAEQPRTMTMDTDWINSPRPDPVKKSLSGLNFGFSSTGSVSFHVDDEKIDAEVALPDEWGLAFGETATLSIEFFVRRHFAPTLAVDMIVDDVDETVVVDPYDLSETTREHFLGSFDLRPATGKSDVVWTLTNELGSRNFVHIIDDPAAPLDTTHLLLNSSSALGGLARTMPLPGGVESVFTWENQRRREDLGTFVDDLKTKLKVIYPDDKSELDPDRIPPQPEASLFDFDAAYGGYGWEVFFHIPTAVAVGLSKGEQHDEAIRWLEKVYNPNLDEPWQVFPLRDAELPAAGPVFDTGDVIVDPDRIAADYPFYYQQATIRRYLETLIAAGDSAYEGETQETLQQAKAIYVAAKQLFHENLGDTLEILTNHAWTNPTLAQAAADDFNGFLPPYNQELRTLYDTIEGRLHNLRHWLDIDGEPLNIPLLAAPIDPRLLQLAAKGSLSLEAVARAEQEEVAPQFLLEFFDVARSAKGYVANLQKTSERLLAAMEKLSDAELDAFRRGRSRDKVARSACLQELVVNAAQKYVAVKEASHKSAWVTLTQHTAQLLEAYRRLGAARLEQKVSKLNETSTEVQANAAYRHVLTTSPFPNIAGTSNGGARPEEGAKAAIFRLILWQLSDDAVQTALGAASGARKAVIELASRVQVVTSQTVTALRELAEAKSLRDKEKRSLENIENDLQDLEDIEREIDSSLINASFYKELAQRLGEVFSDEWVAATSFCQLLVALYVDENGADAAELLKPFQKDEPRDLIDKQVAAAGLALGIERVEEAYIRAAMSADGGSARMSFPLSELPALGGDTSTLATLADQGEVYFELTDEMFDTLYPGQYDRRIESVDIRFPGLAKAGLSPHARLTQISNTRYATRERDPRKGGRIRKDRHALQSILLGAAETDTASFERREGYLKRFQNTGVESRWHLVLPAVLELKRRSGKGRSKAWRGAAERHFETLKRHLDEIEFGVTFSGRW
ncbi:MAG: Tc toxin subunit A [Thermoanaerobaculia bacterium]|nr:Tc toxin subunit A [Thermoanaerobaculia bacterium]